MKFLRANVVVWFLACVVVCLTALGFVRDVYDVLYKTDESNYVRESAHQFGKAETELFEETERDLLGDTELNNNVTMVIIVAYYRSGSSLTGAMYDKDHDTFYSFEPLHRIYTKLVPFREQFERVGYHEKEGPYSPGYEIPAVKRTLESILTCDINNLYKAVAFHTFYDHSRTFSAIKKCKGKSNHSCIMAFIDFCKSKTLRVIKTIRMDMETVDDLMEKYNNLKIIHLIRDPRASTCSTGCSRSESEWLKVCSKIRNDVQTRIRLEKKYQGRLLEMMYEDFTHHPYKMAEVLYRFVGRTLSIDTATWLKEHMLSGKPANGAMGTFRPNSTERAYDWMRKISSKNINIANKNCRYILRYGHFVELTRKDQVRDFVIPHRPFPLYDNNFIKIRT